MSALVEEWWLGATRVAHRMIDLGPEFPVRYRSRCGLFWAKAPRPAADEVRRCGQCVRGLAADQRHTVAHGAAAAPPRLEVAVPVTLPRQVFAGGPPLPTWTLT